MEVMMVVMTVKVVIISSIVIKSTGYNLKVWGKRWALCKYR